ncbi:MAG TPA: phosphotransferase [Candidatus Polarisedimenticolia bacterium]|nr:phosphotransferase [Candidatus Polarisedimenticolia bacterium]
MSDPAHPCPARPDPLITPAIRALLRRKFGRRFALETVAGDASDRRFYRVRAGRRSAILMRHPEALDRRSPLFSNHRILRSIGAPVPRLLGSSLRHGLVLVEDFGDRSLQRHLTSGRTGCSVRTRQRLYRQACDIIVLMQRRAAGALRPGDFAASHALDRERFLFELDHFHRHFVVGLMGRRPGEAEEAWLRVFYADLAEACDRLPGVYCHRDFQSRNLMVRGGRLHLIDFQDARMGPYTYDPASLLRDSSLDLAEDLVERMLAYLAQRLDRGVEEFRADFDLMALQRNIKDLGTFGYLATVRNRPAYLELVPRTLRFVRRTLLAMRRFHFVYPVLDRLVLSYSSAPR